MAANTFLATTGRGLAHAARDPQGDWSVVFLLTDQDIRCLAARPQGSKVVYAGTKGNGVLHSDDGGNKLAHLREVHPD